VKLEGKHSKRPKNKPFLRLITLAASGIFWILFFVVEKEYLARKDSRQKPSGGRRAGKWREVCFSFI
jgi:hypothetical protein